MHPLPDQQYQLQLQFSVLVEIHSICQCRHLRVLFSVLAQQGIIP